MVIKITSKNQITLPKQIVEALHLRKGDILSVDREDNHILLTPQTLEDRYPEDLLARVERKMEKRLLAEEKKFSKAKDLFEDLNQ